MNDSGQTVCLNMIVRNEALVIRRCLASVLPIIDYWLIVDTGSTDGTQDIVRQCLKHVPGMLIERPWVDFGHNRTEALSYARGHGTYILVIDGDEVLEISDAFRKTDLTADSYLVDVHCGSKVYVRKQLLRNCLPWRYVGVLHEYVYCDASEIEQPAIGLRTLVYHDGARARDPLTYRRDAILLETALLSEPDNARYVFYLAQSYRDSGDFELAVRNYQRRVEMGGWSEEIWFSLYQIASLREHMGYPWGAVMTDYLAAFEFEPARAEPLFRIGRHYQRTGDFHLARLFFSRAMQVSYPSRDRLFIEKDVYDYQLLLEYAASSSSAAEYAEAITICNRILRSGLLPPKHIDRVLEIRKLSVQARIPPLPSHRLPERIKICIPFCDAGSEFDDCIESLSLQNGAGFDVVFIDDGSQHDYSDRIPLSCTSFQLLRNEVPVGLENCVDRFITNKCAPSDIVIPLAYTSRLANRDVILRIRTIFENEGCDLLYGQHRLPCGMPGDAEPAASEAEFLERRAELANRSPICFRARLWRQHFSQASKDSAPAEQGDRGGAPLTKPLLDALMEAAAFRRTSFSEEIFTILADSALASQSGAVTAAAKPNDRRAQVWIEEREVTPQPVLNGQLPTVSCLMVTHDRITLAKRAIQFYASQSYPNRELVIVSDGGPRVRNGLERFVSDLRLENVRFVYPDAAPMTLGQLRNVAMDAARGEILCQWDDDDCYHPQRIHVQVEHMLKKSGRACCLTDHLQFLEEDRALVWVDWSLGGKSGKDQLLPGTIIMFKDERFRYPESGPFAQRGEDSILLYDIYQTVGVVAAKDVGYLYLYTYHGRNTFDKEHHYRMSIFSRSVSELERARTVICRAMAHYPVPKPYLVVGRDGPAFFLND
jgi:glycosyltransferase involved in cell wall biosynthesis